MYRWRSIRFDKTPAAESFELKGDFGTYLQFRVLTIRLPGIDAMSRSGSQNIVERICLPLMQYPDNQKRTILRHSVDGLLKFEKNSDKRTKYSQFIFRYGKLDPGEVEKLREDVSKNSQDREGFMSALEVLRADGKAEGEAKGKAEGEIKAIMSLLARAILSPAQARDELERLSKEGDISPEQLRAALAQIQ